MILRNVQLYWVLENHRTFVFEPQTLDIRASDYALETPENNDVVRVNSRVQSSVSIYLRFVCTSPMSSWLPILYSSCYKIVVTPLYRKYPIVYSSLDDWLLPFHCWIGSGFISAPVILFTLLSLHLRTYLHNNISVITGYQFLQIFSLSSIFINICHKLDRTIIGWDQFWEC